MVQEILTLGDRRLYQVSAAVAQGENLRDLALDLHDTLLNFRARHGCGRAIAAPQIGVLKRVICMDVGERILLVNPLLTFPDGEMMEVLDDCMSFPGLLVRLMRRRRCQVRYFDQNWQPQEMNLEGDLSELIQHEYDHLDGILATMRAIDGKSFVMKR